MHPECVLLDECVPRRLRGALPGHDVRTVPETGWLGKRNGERLQLRTGQGFEALIPVDQNQRHPQNLQAADAAVIMLVTASNRLAGLFPLMPAAQTALGSISPREVVEIIP